MSSKSHFNVRNMFLNQCIIFYIIFHVKHITHYISHSSTALLSKWCFHFKTVKTGDLPICRFFFLRGADVFRILTLLTIPSSFLLQCCVSDGLIGWKTELCRSCWGLFLQIRNLQDNGIPSLKWLVLAVIGCSGASQFLETSRCHTLPYVAWCCLMSDADANF